MKCPHCEEDVKPYNDHQCRNRGWWKQTHDREGKQQVYECPFCNWMIVPDEVDDHCPNCKARMKFL